MIAGTDKKPFRASQHSTLARRTGSVVSAWLYGGFDLFYLGMLVREPVHGMQGLLERQRYESLTKPVKTNSPLSGVGLLSLPFP
jgi:hypothetical protein